jgi:hypothetical protein
MGIYGALDAKKPVEVYNGGGWSVIAFRALPGKVSSSTIYTAPGEIGYLEFDSYVSDGIYVIRRACQTLPCFQIFFSKPR